MRCGRGEPPTGPRSPAALLGTADGQALAGPPMSSTWQPHTAFLLCGASCLMPISVASRLQPHMPSSLCTPTLGTAGTGRTHLPYIWGPSSSGAGSRLHPSAVSPLCRSALCSFSSLAQGTRSRCTRCQLSFFPSTFINNCLDSSFPELGRRTNPAPSFPSSAITNIEISSLPTLYRSKGSMVISTGPLGGGYLQDSGPLEVECEVLSPFCSQLWVPVASSGKDRKSPLSTICYCHVGFLKIRANQRCPWQQILKSMNICSSL